MESVSNKPLFFSLLALTVLLGIYFRFDANPEPYFFDDRIPVDVIHHMEDKKSLDTNWGNVAWQWYLPHYNNQYNFSSYISALYWLKQFSQSLGVESPPLQLYRFLSLLFQLSAALVMLHVGLRYFSPSVAALSVSFFLICPLFTTYSHYARPESFLMLLCSLLICFHFSKRLAISAFVWGLMIACKFSLAPIAIIALTLQCTQNRPPLKDLLFIVASLLSGLFVLAPYIFINWQGLFAGYGFLFEQYFYGDSGSFSLGLDNFRLLLLLILYLCPVAALVIFFSLKSDKRPHRVFAIFCLSASASYLLFFSLASFHNESNLLQFAPTWSLLFAVGCCQIMIRLKQLLKNEFLLLFFSSFILSFVFLYCCYYSQAYSQCAYGYSNAQENPRVAAQTGFFEATLKSKYPDHSILADSDYRRWSRKLLAGELPEKAIIQKGQTSNKGFGEIEKAFYALGLERVGSIPLKPGLPRLHIIGTHYPSAYHYYTSKN